MSNETQTTPTFAEMIGGKIELTIGGKGKRSRFAPLPVTIDFAALPDASKAFVVRYGLKQYLGDGGAVGKEGDEATWKNGIQAKREKLEKGDFKRSTDGLRKPDTLEGRARKLARQALMADIAAQDMKAGDFTKEALAEAVTEYVKANPKFLAEAKSQLEREAAIKAAPVPEALTGILARMKRVQAEAPEAPESDDDEGEEDEGDED